MALERDHDVTELQSCDVPGFADVVTIERLKRVDVVKILQRHNQHQQHFP